MENERMLHHELNADIRLKNRFLHSVREIVFGLEDGIVSTLGAITGIATATQDIQLVILSGFVIVFVESVSMAAGTFLSSKSQHEVEERMIAEEAYEIKTYPAREEEELREFYRERGFPENEVDIIVARVIQDKELWLEEMAHKELKIIPNKEHNSRTAAGVMGMSYIIGGSVPLLSYFILSVSTAIPASIVLSVCMLFAIGYLKGTLVYGKKIRSGLEMVVVSLSAAAVGYVVGQLVSRFFGI